MNSTSAGAASYRLFEQLPMMPRFIVERAQQLLNTNFPTASAVKKILEELGLVKETTDKKESTIQLYSSNLDAQTA